MIDDDGQGGEREKRKKEKAKRGKEGKEKESQKREKEGRLMKGFWISDDESIDDEIISVFKNYV